MAQSKIKYLLFSILAAALVIPFLCKKFEIVTLKPLTGEYIPAKKDTLTSESWFSGNYQKSYEKFFEENIGLRNFFIRTYNQIDYSLFKVTHGASIVIGKKGYLFEQPYLTSHAGFDFVGEEDLKRRVELASSVINHLKEKNIFTLIVFAPSKADVLPEYVPAFYSRRDTTHTNYEVLRRLLLKSDIPFIDFNDLFIQLKKSSPYPLYPKHGIHWSQYGMYVAVDSLVNFIREKGNLNLNSIYCDSIEMSRELRDTDYDLGDLSNVLFNMSDEEMPYPVLRFENNPQKIRPNLLTIGDSYYWNIYHSGVPKNIFNGANFWYYNHEVYADSLPEKSIINLSTFRKEVERQQVILILTTESNLGGLGFGFFENMSASLSGNDSENPLLELEEEIRNNPDWLEAIKKKAIERNMNLDDMIRADAEWMLKERAKNK